MNFFPFTGRGFGTMLALLSVGLLLLTGCNSNTANTPTQPPPGASPGRGAEGGGGGAAATGGGAVADKGMAVFTASNCGNCHRLNGQGGGKAPDLSKIGGEHDATWIADHIKNPKTHNPGSRMPAFESKISADDLKTLSEYLAGLK